MKHRILFRPTDPAGTGGGAPPADPPAPPAGDPPTDPPQDPPAPPADGGRTFTQAELDAIVKREKAKAEKAAAEKAQADADKAKLDETERLKVEKAEAEQAAAAAQKAAAERIAQTEAKVAALAAGAKPERLAGVLKLADLSEAVGEDGEPSERAISAAIAAVKTEYPELFGMAAKSAASSSGGDFSQGSGGVKRYSAAEMTELAKRNPAEFLKIQPDYLKARAEGRVDA